MQNDKGAARVFAHPIAWLPPIIGGSLALLAPQSIADSEVISILAKFSAIYTGIYELASRSAFQREALTFYSIVFSAFPFQLVLLWLRWKRFVDFGVVIRNFMTLGLGKRLALFALMPLATMVLYWALFFLADDPSFCAGCTTSSKIGMILIVTCGLLGFSVFLFSTLTFFLIIPFVFFNKTEP
jgi:hypothetical protein